MMDLALGIEPNKKIKNEALGINSQIEGVLMGFSFQSLNIRSR